MRRRFQKFSKWRYLIGPATDLAFGLMAYVLFVVGFILSCKKGDGPVACMFAGAILLMLLKMEQKYSKDRD